MDAPDHTAPADAAGAAELDHLRGRFLTDAPADAGTPELVGPDPADTVYATLRPMTALLAASSPVCAAFYTDDKVREISEMFVRLAEVEGWDVSALESKWALRIAFVLVAVPPQGIEWVLSKVVGFAVGGRKVEEKPDRAGQVEAMTDAAPA